MKTRIFTYLACSCGHRGAIVESSEERTSPGGWYQAWLRDLKHNGTYDGMEELFAETKPGCPVCGRSLGPENIIGRNEVSGAAEVLRRAVSQQVPSGPVGL
jgi:hypothetical protein